MASDSSLRHYLQMVETQWEETRKVLLNIMSLTAKRLKPPQLRSTSLSELFKKAVVEAAKVGPHKRVSRRADRLHVLHEQILEIAWDRYKSQSWPDGGEDPLKVDWEQAEATRNELQKLALLVETRLQVALASSAQKETWESRRRIASRLKTRR